MVGHVSPAAQSSSRAQGSPSFALPSGMHRGAAAREHISPAGQPHWGATSRQGSSGQKPASARPASTGPASSPPSPRVTQPSTRSQTPLPQALDSRRSPQTPSRQTASAQSWAGAGQSAATAHSGDAQSSGVSGLQRASTQAPPRQVSVSSSQGTSRQSAVTTRVTAWADSRRVTITLPRTTSAAPWKRPSRTR